MGSLYHCVYFCKFSIIKGWVGGGGERERERGGGEGEGTGREREAGQALES